MGQKTQDEKDDDYLVSLKRRDLASNPDGRFQPPLSVLGNQKRDRPGLDARARNYDFGKDVNLPVEKPRPVTKRGTTKRPTTTRRVSGKR